MDLGYKYRPSPVSAPAVRLESKNLLQEVVVLLVQVSSY
jgi:hypothetical protein